MGDILIKLNFNLKSKGFDFWIKAMELAKKNPNYDMNFIYNEIANTYNLSYKQVEKCMRTASEGNRIIENFNLTKKHLTNSEILRLLIITERRNK